MKTIVFYMLTVLILLSSKICAQDLSTSVANLKKANTEKEYIAIRNGLERLCMQSPGEWLPNYYIAYADVQLSFRTPSKENKLKYLSDADTYLKKLTDISGTDASEFYTLKGYRLYSLIALDPQTNGPKYFGEVTLNYQTALKFNPDNPRAIMLLAMFNNDMAKFMHRTYDDFEAQISKATELFARANSLPNYPSWGKEWLDSRLSAK